MTESGENTAEEIEFQKRQRAYLAFDERSAGTKQKHVKEKMQESAVNEQACQKLTYKKILFQIGDIKAENFKKLRVLGNGFVIQGFKLCYEKRDMKNITAYELYNENTYVQN